MATMINEETMKRLESLAEENNLTINECLNNLIDEDEKMNDPDYIEYLHGINEALAEYDRGEYEEMTVEEFMESL